LCKITGFGNTSDIVILPGSQLPLTKLFVINVLESWNTCAGNNQKILQNIAVNIMGTQMSDHDVTVAFIPGKVCSLLSSLLGKVG